MDFLDYVQQDYRTIEYHNYLVFQQKRELHPIDYCCNMIERNQIPGILPMHTKQLDDQIGFYYDISGKVRLVDYLQRNTCEEAQGRQILFHLAESMKQLSRYFIQQQFCVLDLRYIFMNDALHVFVPVLPIAELQEQEQNIQLFFQQLVSNYFVTEESNAFYDGLLKYLVRAEFQLDDFMQRVKPLSTQKQITERPVKPIAVQPMPEEPVKKENGAHGFFSKKTEQAQKAEQKEIPKKNPMPEIVVPGMQPDIKIPGAIAVEEKPKKEKKPLFGGGAAKEKKEKKEKKEFFSFGQKTKNKKEEEAVSIPVQVSEQPKQIERAIPIPPSVLKNPVPSEETEWVDAQELCQNKPYLVHQNQRISIEKTPFVLGKVQADYYLEKSFVSRVHATILEQDDQYYVRDENSKNHTYLNGIQLAPYTLYPLEDGSRIKLGLEELIFYR